MTPPLTSSKRDQVWEKKRRQWEARRGGSRGMQSDQYQQQQQPQQIPPINTSNEPQPSRRGPSSPLSQFVNSIDQRSNSKSGSREQHGYEYQNYQQQQLRNEPHTNLGPYGSEYDQRVNMTVGDRGERDYGYQNFPHSQQVEPRVGYGSQPSKIPATSQPPISSQQDDYIFRQASAQLSARARSRERVGPQANGGAYLNSNDYYGQQHGQQAHPQGSSQSQFSCPPPPSQGAYGMTSAHCDYASQQNIQYSSHPSQTSHSQYQAEQISYPPAYQQHPTSQNGNFEGHQGRWLGTGQNGAASVRVQAPPGGKSNITFG